MEVLILSDQREKACHDLMGLLVNKMPEIQVTAFSTVTSLLTTIRGPAVDIPVVVLFLNSGKTLMDLSELSELLEMPKVLLDLSTFKDSERVLRIPFKTTYTTYGSNSVEDFFLVIEKVRSNKIRGEK